MSWPPVLLSMPDYCGTLAAARCLGRAGADVWMAGDSRTAMSMHSRFVTRTLEAPHVHDSPAWVDWLEGVGRANPGLVLPPTSDDVAWLLARHRERLEPHFRLWAPPLAVYERVLDKAQLDEACGRVGLGSPPTLAPTNERELDEAVARAELPVLLKQRTQILSPTNHKGVLVRERAALGGEYRRFRDANRHPAAVRESLPHASAPLLQRYFAEGVSGSLQVSGFIDETGELFVARAAKKLLQRPKTLGISLCLETTELPAQLARKVRALCLDVGYFGMFALEFLQVDGEALLIDFNPRTYHFLALDLARGMPLPLLAMLAATGERARLADEVRKAQHDSRTADAFTYRFQLKELLLAQTATGTMHPRESAQWWKWYRAHASTLVDAVDDADDRRPHVMDVATGLARRIRHPGAFLRRIAFDR